MRETKGPSETLLISVRNDSGALLARPELGVLSWFDHELQFRRTLPSEQKKVVWCFMVSWMTKYQWLALLAGLVLPQTAAMSMAEEEQAPTNLPIYEVVETGATASQAAALAKRLGIRSSEIVSPGGVIEFVDPNRFLALPEEKAPESPLLDRVIEATRNKDTQRKITPTILNARAIGELQVFSENPLPAPLLEVPAVL